MTEYLIKVSKGIYPHLFQDSFLGIINANSQIEKDFLMSQVD